MFIDEEDPEGHWVVTKITDPLAGKGEIDVIRHGAQGVSLLCDSKEQAEFLAELLNDRLIAPLVDNDTPDDAPPTGVTVSGRVVCNNKILPENQCDGCRRGLPIVDGIHVETDGRLFMGCTAVRY